MAIEIKEIYPTRGELKKFIHFSIDLYKDNEYYVPPLILDEINTP